MRAKRWLVTAVPVLSGLVLAVAGASAAPALSQAARLTGTAGQTATAPHEVIYVANADSGPVTVYAAGSSGSVAAVSSVLTPNDNNAVWDPWGVAFDTTGHLYVQSFLSDATTFVFRPGAHGTTAPLRDFMGNGPDNRDIAVDSKGYEYIVGGDGAEELVVEPPGARGAADNLYYVPPVRTIYPDESWNPWPSDLAVDAKNEVLQATARPQGNAIEIYTGGAHGSDNPVRVISGPHTGLGSCGSLCDVSIAYSGLNNRIYAAVSDGTHTHISVFAGNASGDAYPVRTIEGPATGLTGRYITGITVSGCNGFIYAMAHTSSYGFGPARVYVYARLAHGNVRPLRSFTDRHTGFDDAQGLVIKKTGTC